MMNEPASLISFALFTLAGVAFAGNDLAPLCADRTAIECVYHEHRTGTKKSFEETMPPALIEQLVKADAHKEAVLKRVYGVEITPAMVEAEVKRIDTTTRAPEMLAEIKRALGDDPVRFARAMARPIVVERILREKFENDDALHAPQRKAMEALRADLLAAKAENRSVEELSKRMQSGIGGASGQWSEVAWQLGPRPAEVGSASPAQPSAPTRVDAKAGPYSVEATAQIAQVLSAPESACPENERKFYFEDLPGEMQNLLRAQLCQPGDVSAVVESLTGFSLFLAESKTAEILKAASASLHKRDYDQWLAEQTP